MPRYVTQITTHLDRDQVFSDLSHFDRAAEWDPGVAAGVMLTAEPVEVGSRFALRARFFGRTIPMMYEVIEFEPGSRVVLRAETPFVRSIDAISFEPVASDPAGSAVHNARPRATVVTYDARLEAKGVARLAGPLLGLAFRRIGDRAAIGLRERLSSEVAR